MTMHKLLLAVAAVAPAFTLSACGAADPATRGLESVNQPVVELQDYAFDVNAGSAGLAPGEAARVGEWFATMRLGYGDKVSIDDPVGPRAAVYADVARQAARYGILVADAAPVTPAPVAAGTVRIVLSRARASVPGCPDFSRYRGPELESRTNSNHGCATNTNLAAMVADPLDLIRGAPGVGGYDPEQAARAINAYRKAAPTGAGGTALKTETTGGK